MEKLGDNHYFPTVKRAVRHCALRLTSRPTLGECASIMGACRATLVRCEDAYDDALDRRVAATAEVGYCDAVLGKAVAALARDINALVDGKTDDARYQRVFLSAPSEAMRPVGGAEQDRFVKNILETLETDAAYEDVRKHGGAIAARQRDLEDAIARRDALTLAERQAGRELDIATAEARDTYNQMAHRVALVYPKDAALVDSFFWSAAQDRAARAEAPDAPVPLSGAVADGAAVGAVVQQPANESATVVQSDKRARRRRRSA